MLNGERPVGAERDLNGPDRIQFIHLYPADTNPQQASDLSLRLLFCKFLGCCLLIVLARAEDITENQVWITLPLLKKTCLEVHSCNTTLSSGAL